MTKKKYNNTGIHVARTGISRRLEIYKLSTVLNLNKKVVYTRVASYGQVAGFNIRSTTSSKNIYTNQNRLNRYRRSVP